MLEGGGRRGRNVLHQEPRRLGLAHDARKLWDQVRREFETVVDDERGQPAEPLAWWPADDAGEVPGRRVEPVDIPTPQQIGSTHHAEALVLERAVEQADAGEEGQDERAHRSRCLNLTRTSCIAPLQSCLTRSTLRFITLPTSSMVIPGACPSGLPLLAAW